MKVTVTEWIGFVEQNRVVSPVENNLFLCRCMRAVLLLLALAAAATNAFQQLAFAPRKQSLLHVEKVEGERRMLRPRDFRRCRDGLIF